jgi:hypothetical protein
MRPGLQPLATAAVIQKPRATAPYRVPAPSCLRASSPRHEQGGILTSSLRESVRANGQDPLSRRPAVVGLVAPPYGLPSTDPTTRPSASVPLRVTPVPSSRCSSADADGRHVPAAPTVLSAKRGWSAHADNRTRFGNSPLNPLPLRGPQRRGADHLLVPTLFLPTTTTSGARRLFL